MTTTPASSILRAAFTTKKSLWEGFASTPRETIPPSLHSPRAAPGAVSVVGLGFLNAAYLLLSGATRFQADPDALRVRYASTGSSSDERVLTVDSRSRVEIWSGDGVKGGTGPALMAYGLALRGDSRFTHTRVALKEVLAAIATPTCKLPQINPLMAKANFPLRDALLHLSDCAYRDLLPILNSNVEFEPDQSSERSLPELDIRILLDPQSPTPRKDLALNTLTSRLERLIRRGGAALLVGPPGTFKTESAKRAAREGGAHLTVLKGAPGVEDRDFIGAVQPGEEGPVWRDGPLTRAYLAAQSGRSVLLIDEALRFEAAYLNVLIGALDTMSRADLKAMGLEDEVIGSHPGRFYALTLPSGEIIACPATHLSVILTTNWGDDHLQTSDRLDGALSSRMDLTVEVTTPDPETLLEIFVSIAGTHTDLIAPLERLMEHTQDSLQAGGLYSRGLDARKAMALLREARALKEEGLTTREAFLEALEVTGVPHCCPRDPDGALNPEAAQTLREFASKIV